MGRVLEYPFSNVIENVAGAHVACSEHSRHRQQQVSTLNLNTAAAALMTLLT